MTTKKKRTRTKTTSKEETSKAITLGAHTPTVPWLKKAIIYLVDHGHRWEKETGKVMSAMPRIAHQAADYMSLPNCYFCDAKQEPLPKEIRYHFHPEYPLCECLTPERRVAHEYIPGWESVEGKRDLLARVNSGKLEPEAYVYQFVCSCGEGPVRVNAGMIVAEVRRSIAKNLNLAVRPARRTLCRKCFAKSLESRNAVRSAARQHRNPKAVLTAPIKDLVATTPKQGPAAKISRHEKRHKKTHPPANMKYNAHGMLKEDPPEVSAPIPEGSLPPLSALDKKVPEAPTTA